MMRDAQPSACRLPVARAHPACPPPPRTNHAPLIDAKRRTSRAVGWLQLPGSARPTRWTPPATHRPLAGSAETLSCRPPCARLTSRKHTHTPSPSLASPIGPPHAADGRQGADPCDGRRQLSGAHGCKAQGEAKHAMGQASAQRSHGAKHMRLKRQHPCSQLRGQRTGEARPASNDCSQGRNEMGKREAWANDQGMWTGMCRQLSQYAAHFQRGLKPLRS